ncbi:hypothetical protein LY78DRAFT_661203 [Colletotrichum sublineola]|nr:hypothetical protein LY78DRAFT_661203 [Colletotrichum sublineola]
MISRSQVCALDPEKVAGSSPATVIALTLLFLPAWTFFGPVTWAIRTSLKYCFCFREDY